MIVHVSRSGQSCFISYDLWPLNRPLLLPQFNLLHVGDKYRIGMYVCTSTDRDSPAIEDLRDWQEATQSPPKCMWVFNIPSGCRQAAKISQVSACPEENEVLLVP